MRHYALTFLFEKQNMQYNDFMSLFSIIRKILLRITNDDSMVLELQVCYGSGKQCNNPDGASKPHFHGVLETTCKLTPDAISSILQAITSAIGSISLRNIKPIFDLSGWVSYMDSHPKLGKVFRWSKAQKDTDTIMQKQEQDLLSGGNVAVDDVIIDGDSCTNNQNIDITNHSSNQANNGITVVSSCIAICKTLITKLRCGFLHLRSYW